MLSHSGRLGPAPVRVFLLLLSPFSLLLFELERVLERVGGALVTTPPLVTTDFASPSMSPFGEVAAVVVMAGMKIK